VKLLNSAAFGPSHDYHSQFDVNWTQRIYEHQGQTVYLDRFEKSFEVFVASTDNLCFIGEFSAASWCIAEPRASLAVDCWLTDGYQPRTATTRSRILQFIRQSGSPTIPEIAEHVNRAKRTVQERVAGLVRLGKIHRIDGYMVREGPAPITADATPNKVLRYILQHDGPTTIQEIAEHVNCAKRTVQRHVVGLVRLGKIHRVAGHRIQAGPAPRPTANVTIAGHEIPVDLADFYGIVCHALRDILNDDAAYQRRDWTNAEERAQVLAESRRTILLARSLRDACLDVVRPTERN